MRVIGAAVAVVWLSCLQPVQAQTGTQQDQLLFQCAERLAVDLDDGVTPADAVAISRCEAELQAACNSGPPIPSIGRACDAKLLDEMRRALLPHITTDVFGYRANIREQKAQRKQLERELLGR